MKPLVFAQVISVSPDGRYLLFVSNRNFMDNMGANNFELFAFDMHTFIEYRIMDFTYSEILAWDKNNPRSFLFRESRIAADGTRYSSQIYSYSLESRAQSVFLNVREKYRAYEMIGDEYIYITSRIMDEETERWSTALYIANIYTREMFRVDAGEYSRIWDVRMSDTKEYLAFWAQYMTSFGWLLTELVTVHVATNDLLPQYDTQEGEFIVNSFYWVPNNILIVNFENLQDLSRDAARFHRITHTARGVSPNINSVHDLEQ